MSLAFSVACVSALLACLAAVPCRAEAPEARADGYRGVWYSISQGGKVAYSGGLGVYPPHMRPMAIYAPEAKKTFFVYGGGDAADNRHCGSWPRTTTTKKTWSPDRR